MEHEETRTGAHSSGSRTSEESNWLDLEPDVESVRVLSFFDDLTFSTLADMLNHCKEHYRFDLLAIVRRLDLEFLEVVKLVNFIRSQARSNSVLPELILHEHIEPESFLKPVIDNDAAIFLLDEVLTSEDSVEDSEMTSAVQSRSAMSSDLLENNKLLQAELDAVREGFADYRLAVEHTLNRRWEIDEDPRPAVESTKKDSSGYYFESYAARDIHETMLKDTVRTEAYRDFIYGNKHIFQGKTVLDIGCGTGILSMFCAKAGATCVLAVEKSDIIEKARENAFNNKLSDVITFVKGSIEEVTLPVVQVDIIVSEWMGYCLLYEAMLPSIIYARDKYLKPDGLLIPSSATIWIAPVKDDAYNSEHVSYWQDVYGFDMKAMQEGLFNDVRIDALPEDSLCGGPYPFKVLDLYQTQSADLSFTARWTTELDEGIKHFDGFLIWFDIYFSPFRTSSLPSATTTPSEFMKALSGNVAFTTGPNGPETHWKQGLLLAAPQESQSTVPALGPLAGRITFTVHSENARALLLQVSWMTEKGEKQQQWELK